MLKLASPFVSTLSQKGCVKIFIIEEETQVISA